MSVWILAEQEGGLPARITFELLTAGRRLAEALGQPLGAWVVGAGGAPFAQQLIALGADQVRVVDSPAPTPEAAVAAIAAGHAPAPAWILTGHTRLGTEVAARLAVRLEAGLVTACTAFEVAGDAVVGCRPQPDGGIARAIAYGPPGLFTLLPGCYPWPSEQPDRTGAIEAIALPEPLAARIQLLQATPEGAPPLWEADVVVAGGLGMGGPEHWHLLERLASMLGGAVGASGAAVEVGWRPESERIGLTGHVIAPRVYIACGIHGSAEHLAGLRGAPRVIALNPDPAAPLMRRADLAVCGDARAVLPEWIAALARSDR